MTQRTSSIIRKVILLLGSFYRLLICSLLFVEVLCISLLIGA